MSSERGDATYQRYQAYMSKLHAYLQLPPKKPVPRPSIANYRERFMQDALRVETDTIARINRDLLGHNHEGKMTLAPPDFPLQWSQQFVHPRYSRHTYHMGELKHAQKQEHFHTVRLQQAMDRFFDASRHVSYAEFKAQLSICFEQLLQEAQRRDVTTLYLPIPYYDKHLQDISVTTRKSNFWVAQHLQQCILRRNSNLSLKITFGTEAPYLGPSHSFRETSGSDIVVVLDDASYTGSQLIDNTLECLRTWVHGNDLVFIAVPFLSVEAQSKIAHFVQKYVPVPHVFASHQTFAPLSHVMPPHVMARLFRFRYGVFAQPEPAQARVCGDCEEKYAFYFDHKTPDYMSGFPDLYSGVLPVVGNEGVPDAEESNSMCRRYPFVLSDLQGPVHAAVVDTRDAPPVPPYKPPRVGFCDEV